MKRFKLDQKAGYYNYSLKCYRFIQFLRKKGKKLLNSDETSTLQTDKE